MFETKGKSGEFLAFCPLPYILTMIYWDVLITYSNSLYGYYFCLPNHMIYGIFVPDNLLLIKNSKQNGKH